MNAVKVIAKNTLVLMASQVTGLAFGLFFIVYTARYLGAEGFGVLSFALAFTGIFSVFTDLGLNTLSTRELSRGKAQAPAYLGNILAIKIILSMVAMCIITPVMLIGDYPGDTIIAVYLLMLSIVFSTFTGTFNSIFQAFEKMEYQSFSGILGSFLMVAGAFAIHEFGYGIVAFAGLYAVVNFLIMAYSLVICFKEFAVPGLRADIVLWHKLLKEALPFAATGISINVYLWMNTIILSRIDGSEAAGWYNAAFKLAIALLFIPVVFNTSFFPAMSRSYAISKDILRASFEKLLKFTLLIGFPLGAGMIAMAGKIIDCVYGSQFGNSVVVLQVLSLSLVLIFFRSPFERLLEASNRQAIVTKIFVAGAIFSLIANLVLINYMSYLGAGVAMVLTDSLVFIALVAAIKGLDISVQKSETVNITKMLLASLIMGGFIMIFSHLSLLVLVILSIGVYSTLLLLFGVISKDEVRLLKHISCMGDRNDMSDM